MGSSYLLRCLGTFHFFAWRALSAGTRASRLFFHAPQPSSRRVFLHLHTCPDSPASAASDTSHGFLDYYYRFACSAVP
ncbi:uncharacterized protein EDB93DRAFT_70197 [Suillus bovinus]|uniref:uncharacterized protein n=1 Tax=Suillus bovinus TaxID=48563 RepID=UPI001B867C19|nr:uncharacterized protein EDB93DRAFT_70197 [Suillus bovinus]KAG2130772.1 hypothetical protein EDB93DRAFT_70197 [Suillus bovinus]